MLTFMPPIRICHKCEQLLTTAANAMRRHAADMHNAISFVKTDMTEEQVDKYKVRLIASFNDGQSAWDAYHSHLREHGILPIIP